MPYLNDSAQASSQSTENIEYVSFNSQNIISDEEYARLQNAGSQELPLSQQLEPIAVVGMGCRLPGDVSTPSDFWNMMINEQSGQTPRVPASRFNIDAHLHENNDRPGSFNVEGGYFINETLQEFDPSFFGITPVEAMWMDPQQRKLLEVVYEAFESAGVTLPQISGSDTACFIATFTADFQQMSFKEPSFRHSLAATGVDPGIISNRISHVFNLTGPSIVVNTACSSSVYAIHNACNALRNEECSAAVVGGSNLILTVDQHMNTAKLGVLSPKSTCHTFNSYANGYGRAEGVGAVYLKRLKDAIADGDPVRGIIRSSATNNNGKVAGVGITHPSFDGQRSVIKHAYKRGGYLDPLLTGYFECHGTGTAIGDPLEVRAVSDSMNSERIEEDGPLNIGAVKTNIGHSEAASGLSAVIKAILMVERNMIPPSHGVRDLNPKIDWKTWQVYVPTVPTPFPEHLPVSRVSVNSFGYGGTNAHIIVERANSLLTLPQSYRYLENDAGSQTPKTRGKFKRGRPSLLLFSANDKAALRRNIAAHGVVASSYDLLDLSYTLANHRTAFTSRAMTVCCPDGMNAAFEDGLSNFQFGESKKIKSLGFAFTGQGAQWAQMAASLIAYYPTFRQSIRNLDSTLEELPDAPEWTLEDVLMEDKGSSRINEAEFSQPLCTAVQIALVQLLGLWNIRPDVTCGHSSGEIAAAYAAGIITSSEAIILAFYRGRAVREVQGDGAMLAVGLGAEAAAPYISAYAGDVVVACYNSPLSVTLSGNAASLEIIQAQLASENVFARLVKTNGKAYHSGYMQPAAERYEALVEQVEAALFKSGTREPRVKMVSSVTGDVLAEDSVLDAKYWSANLLNPVRFNQAVQIISNNSQLPNIDALVEIGPHSALSGPIKQIKAECSLENLSYIPSLVRGESCAASILKLAGELFLRDYSMDLRRITAIEEESTSGKIKAKYGHLLVDLPPYQWDKTKSYWAESRESREHRNADYMRHDVLGQRTIGGSRAEPTWRNVLRLRDLPWLKDHSLGGEAVFPAAGYFAMAMEAVTQINELSSSPVAIQNYSLRNVAVKQALITPDDDDGIEVLFNLRNGMSTNEGSGHWYDFNVSSISQDGQTKQHMSGSVGINSPQTPTRRAVPSFTSRASGFHWNQTLKEYGFNYGPTFQDMDNITFDGKTYAAHATTKLKTSVPGMVAESRYVLHPATVDSCLQLMIVAIWAGQTSQIKFGAVPVEADEVTIWCPTEEQLSDGKATAFSWIDPRGARSFNAHNQLFSNDGQVLMEIKSMRCSAYEAAIPMRSISPLEPQPYASMATRQDVDSLTGTQDLDIPGYLELAFFKRPGLKTLCFDLLSARKILENISDIDLYIESAESETFASMREVYPTVKLATSGDVFDAIIGLDVLEEQRSSIADMLTAGGLAILADQEPVVDKVVRLAGLSDSGVKITNGSTSIPVLYKETAEVETVKSNGIKPSPPKFQVTWPFSKQPELATELVNVLTREGHDVCSSDMSKLLPHITDVIFVADFTNPYFLQSLSKEDFEDLKGLLNNAERLIWVSPGGLAGKYAANNAGYAMGSGLLRSFRSENPSVRAIFADFDMNTTSISSVAKYTVELAVRQTNGEANLETEYYFSSGKTFISRVIADDAKNKTYGKDNSTELRPFQKDLRLKGVVHSGRVIFEDAGIDETELGPGQVEVHVHASGLDQEGAQVIGGTEFRSTFSHEIVGTVHRIGQGVESFNTGDRVVGFSNNCFASFQAVDQHLLQKISENEKEIDMASLPMAYGMAIYGLEELAKLSCEDLVLVLPGTGAAGDAAIHVTKAIGATPFIIVETPEQVEHVRSIFELGSKQVLLQKEWLRNRHETKFDVVFSSGFVDDSVAKEAWESLSPFGRFINCDRKSLWGKAGLDLGPAVKGGSYLSFDLLDLCIAKPAKAGRLLQRVLSMYRQQRLPLLTLDVKSIDKLNDCVTSFSSHTGTPKVVIKHTASDDGMVEVLPAQPRVSLRRDDATYFLVGCLGGLGRSISSWMVKRGARNLMYLSRSGADSLQAAALVRDLEDAGANVQVIKGDASVKDDVQRALSSVPSSRPVRGVINAAMVLRDEFVYNMSHGSWEASTQPKVGGSRTLHEVFSETALDFFIMTSSVSGILGTPGQSNYAAGNAYMDALAQHRRLHGKPAVSIMLPMVLGVGVVAESTELEESLKRKGMYGIGEEEVLSAFELAVLEQQDGSKDGPGPSHVVVGLDPTLLNKAKHGARDEVDAFWERDRRFGFLMQAIKAAQQSSGNGGDSDGDAGSSVLDLVHRASTVQEAQNVVAVHVAGKLSRMLMLDMEEFEDTSRSITSFGIDSMIGAELRSWIFKELSLDIPFQQLLAPGLTLLSLGDIVCRAQGLLVEEG